MRVKFRKEAKHFMANDASPLVLVQFEGDNTLGIVLVIFESVPNDVVLHVCDIRKRGFAFAALALGYVDFDRAPLFTEFTVNIFGAVALGANMDVASQTRELCEAFLTIPTPVCIQKPSKGTHRPTSQHGRSICHKF